MEIAKIDPNFVLPGAVQREDIVWLNAASEPFVIYGATQTNPYARLPMDVAKTVSEGVQVLSTHTAGIRARFCTDSPYIAIHVEWNEQCRMPHMPFSGISGFDLYRVTGDNHKQTFVASLTPPVICDQGYESQAYVPAQMAEYVLNFPLYNNVSKLLIGVKQGSQWKAPNSYANDKPVIFYGSSITQGGCASRPGTCYQNFLSRALDMDYVNLGFSGNCRAEDTMIAYLASLPMSVFVSDYDHNTPTVEHLAATHEKLYRGIRQAHPHVPYVMLTKPDYHDTPDERARRAIVMQTYQKAIAEGDANVYFVDGASLFAGDQSEDCTVDGCHPTDLGFYRFYRALLPVFERIYAKRS